VGVKVPGIVIVGAQWGDEGKGKFVDVFTERADLVVRFQGGSNAGHTIVIDGKKTALSLLPSGMLRPGVKCLLGAGVVINPTSLIQEMDRLRAAGGEVSPERFIIDRDAHLVLDYHIAIDRAREIRLGVNKIGTTGKGIGPCYEDRSQRTGIRCADLLNLEAIRERVKNHVIEKNKILKFVLESDTQVEFEPLWSALKSHAKILSAYIGNGSVVAYEALKGGQNVIFEGAQGVLLDTMHGTYPYVTSSNTIAGGAAIGVGIGPRMIDSVVGLAKAYSTRVGEGPFPTELRDKTGDELRERGHEFGTITGRARRCGWFDAVALRRAIRISGIDSLIVTKLDVLTGQPNLKICVGYRRGGKKVNDLPALVQEYQELEMEYIEVPGWSEDISKATSWSDLPKAAQDYIMTIEKLVECPVGFVSVGPDRVATIPVNPSPLLRGFLK
jgi:adenylosuccinate synthase